MKPLSPADRDLLGRYRQATRHTRPQIDASLAQVLDRIETGPAPPVVDRPTPVGRGGILKLVAGCGAGLAVGVALALGTGTPDIRAPIPILAPLDVPKARPEPPVAAVVASPPRPVPAPRDVDPPAVPPAPDMDPDPNDAKPTAKAAPEQTAPKTVSSADEIALMARARRALRRGDPARALALLDEHAEHFPRGQLRRDREASRVTALCALGQPNDAKKIAQNLGSTAPGMVNGGWTGCPRR